jgi:HEAT repeat protein
LPVVAGAINDQDEGVRIAAIGILANWPGADATRHLIGLLTSRGSREDILRALATPVRGRIEGVLSALQTADDELAPRLMSILGRIDPDDATGAVLQALRLPNPAARKAAAAMLAAKSTRAALDALKQQALQDPSDEVRRVCALFLSQ